MSVHRFLARAEKRRAGGKTDIKPDHFGGIFTTHDDVKRKPDKEEDRKVTGILERLRQYGVDTMVEANAKYALRTSNGDSAAAFRLLMLLQETYEGLLRPYDPNTQLLGAVNREGVTCYLDALLFAMFARLDSFEAMLYDVFEEPSRKKLAGLLRLWVNMLRTGRLIPTHLTAHVQSALAECGWADAARLKQQDPSEAFTFITGQLELPLLTLKMDLYHTGKEDPKDDHKFVNERLLEVALLDAPAEGRPVITLEDCLEQYFNNRIEVKRHLEQRRRNTLQSGAAPPADSLLPRVEKESGLHIEVVECVERPDTPVPPTSTVEIPAGNKPPTRPTAGRTRADSIFSQRRVEPPSPSPLSTTTTSQADDPSAGMLDGKQRMMSTTRTEVLMPAWQFFKLLPWYTDHLPTSDAQVAAHFASKRPVLGICLKRYAYTPTGRATRRDKFIDIPLEIGVPSFVEGETAPGEPSEGGDEAGDAHVGEFKLVLQSVICHRGVSVHSGHYIALCRGRAQNAQHGPTSPLASRRDSGGGEVADEEGAAEERDGDEGDEEPEEDPWMRFDDLAAERVSYVDIRQALRQETPYLLFYQVLPFDADLSADDGDLPSYAATMTSRAASDVTNASAYSASVYDKKASEAFSAATGGSEAALSPSNSSGNSTTDPLPSPKSAVPPTMTIPQAPTTAAADFAAAPPERASLEVTRSLSPKTSTIPSLGIDINTSPDQRIPRDRRAGATPDRRASLDPHTQQAGRSSLSIPLEGRRRSIVFDAASFGAASAVDAGAAVSPTATGSGEEKGAGGNGDGKGGGGFLALASKIGSRRGSRTSSKRISGAFSTGVRSQAPSSAAGSIQEGGGGEVAGGAGAGTVDSSLKDEKMTVSPPRLVSPKKTKNKEKKRSRHGFLGREGGGRAGTDGGRGGERDCVLM